jgi:hypothetical protein
VSGYHSIMRAAAGILFAIAIITLIGGIAVNLFIMNDMPDFVQQQGNFGLMQKISSVLQVLQAAVWPFFGAALLWRFDRWQPKAAEAAE